MNDVEMARFFQALDTLGEFFADTLTPLRQRVYWNIFQSVDIDAWEAACMQVMATETFHKVPLPAVLMVHVRAYQTEQLALTKAQTQTAYDTWFAQRVALIDAATETGISPPREEIPAEARAMLDKLFGPNSMRDVPAAPAYESAVALEHETFEDDLENDLDDEES